MVVQAANPETFGLTQPSFTLICEVLQRFPQIDQALIFGSRAKGMERKGSDVDLALVGKDVDERLALDVSGILNEREPLPYHFDVVALGVLENTDLREHIERVGRIFFERGDHVPLASPINNFEI